MRKEMRWTALVAGLLFMASCGKQIPRDIIQPAQMEEVLYDYHLSASMTNNLKPTESYKKTSYANYVFQKHGITEAEFDSSMVWYTRHAGELAAIYSNLDKRLKEEKNRIQSVLDAREATDFVSMPGDTVEAWCYKKLYWLTSTPLNNLFTFEIKPDSNYHAKDAFLWKANYTFLAEGKATMALNIRYDNDSVIGQSKQITASGMDSIYLYNDSARNILNINGFIYLKTDSAKVASLIINELSLMKYHAESDSISGAHDTIPSIEKQLPKPKIRSEKLKQIDPTL